MGTTQKLVLQSLNDVEAQLGILGKRKAAYKKIEARKKAQIAKIKAELDEETNDLEFEINENEVNIEAYIRANIDDIRADGKMSLKFATGTVKTREIDDIDYPEEDDLVAAIKELKMMELLIIEEKPSKSMIKAMAKKDDALYNKLGITVTPDYKITIKTI